MNYIHRAKAIRPLLCLIGVLLAGCTQTVIPSPSLPTTNTITSSKIISAPINIKASHGLKSKITISWDPVYDAQRYFIYSSESPHENYTQVSETTSTSCDVSVPTGYTAYYKVCSVQADGSCSTLSLAIMGSSLACPVITSIESESNETTLYWYMNNASSATYQKSVRYTLYCLNAQGQTLSEGSLSGENTDDTQYTFTNLASGTSYKFKVEASLNIDGQNNIETSSIVDSQTLISLIPQAPSVTVTEGTSKSSITLSITLPEMVKVSSTESKGSYDNYPLYFKILRRQTNSEWETLVSHLYFTGKVSSGDIGTVSSGSIDYNMYTAGDVITWQNTTSDAKPITRGVEYEYKIQSYADNITKTITTDKSATTVTGWAASIPSFLTKDYSTVTIEETVNEESVKRNISASIQFTGSWADLGKASNYKFIISENRKKLASDNNNLEDTGGSDTPLSIFSTLQEVNAYKRTYSLESSPENTRGYYSYTLYIVPSSTVDMATGISNALDSVTAAGVTLVTDTADLPKADLVISDHYKDKAILSWTSQTNATYSVVRYSLDSSGNSNSDTITINETTLGTGSGETKTYTDTNLNSGTKYVYTMYASKDGLKVPSSPITISTLGVPTPSFSEENTVYDSITVTWEKVLAASSYLIKLDSTEITITDDELNGASLSNDIFSYTFESPSGYDNATVSGTTKTVILKASSYENTISADSDESTPDSTTVRETSESSVATRTLGPALSALTASKGTDPSSITVTWKEIKGAVGYALERTRAKVGSETEDKTDVYYVTANGVVTQNGENVTGVTVSKAVSGNDTIFTLLDKQTSANDSTNSYQVNQERIAWGLPFTYTLLPVNSSDDVNTTEDFIISYSNISSIKKVGYTTGFGLNVKASKADYHNKINITWEQPANLTSGVYPNIFYRESSSSVWNKVQLLSDGTQEYNLTLDDSSKCKTYEFAVTYYNSEQANFTSSYENYLAAICDSDGEQENLGYEFTLSTLVAQKPTSSTEYTETVLWSLYDSDNRKKAPGNNLTANENGINNDCYTIYTKNLNNGPSWFPIATMSQDGDITTLPEYKDWYDVSLESLTGGSLGIKITALNNGSSFSDDSGYHNGLLKVQRDYKHYYKIEALRKNSAGDLIVASLGAFDGVTTTDDESGSTRNDSSVYTYRKITGEEFAKCITLITADGVQKSDGSSTTINGKTGSLNISLSYNIAVYYNFVYSFSNYMHIFVQSPGSSNELSSGFLLNSNNSSNGRAYSNKVYEFDTATINATHETGLPSYTGSITLYAGQNSNSAKYYLNLSYTHSSVTGTQSKIVDSDETTFKQWFPYALGDSISSGDSTTSTYPTMNNLWWEEKE